MEKESTVRKTAKPVKIEKALTVVDSNPTPAMLMQQAIAQGTDISQLEKLMDLQDRWEAKQAKKSFFDALSRFQTTVPALKKKKTAKIQSQKGSFSYKYADLGGITADIKKPLNECGLSYRWEFAEVSGRLKVTCLISHRDGHTETTAMEAGMDTSGAKNDIQQKGSTQTYLQRYTLIGALGLSTADEDVDGKGHPTTTDPGKELSEEEILGQWQQSVDAVKTKLELKALFLKNKKAVEGNEKIQAIFKARQDILNKADQPNGAKVAMP